MKVRRSRKHSSDKLVRVKRLQHELEKCKKELSEYKVMYPPGHYHSPVVSIQELQKKEHDLFGIPLNQIPGVNLCEKEQLQLLHKLVQFYHELPFKPEKQNHLRYYYHNDFYSYSDAIFLHLIIRHFRPKGIIEVGSGFSSAVMLDTNEIFFQNEIKITFIEPFPERLFSLCKETDRETHKIIISDMQDVEIDIFQSLEENDILFIDSSHVSKTGSDVNCILFKILPLLKKGVLIHFHDIFYPFEYHRDWVFGWSGFGWNEAYLLKAFLMFNDKFKILLFNNFLEYFHEDWFRTHMPLCLVNRGGSVWLKKL